MGGAASHSPLFRFLRDQWTDAQFLLVNVQAVQDEHSMKKWRLTLFDGVKKRTAYLSPSLREWGERNSPEGPVPIRIKKSCARYPFKGGEPDVEIVHLECVRPEENFEYSQKLRTVLDMFEPGKSDLCDIRLSVVEVEPTCLVNGKPPAVYRYQLKLEDAHAVYSHIWMAPDVEALVDEGKLIPGCRIRLREILCQNTSQDEATTRDTGASAEGEDQSGPEPLQDWYYMPNSSGQLCSSPGQAASLDPATPEMGTAENGDVIRMVITELEILQAPTSS